MEDLTAKKAKEPCLISGCAKQSAVRGVCQSCRQSLQRRMKAGVITAQTLESILSPSKRSSVVDQFIGLKKLTMVYRGEYNENN